MNSSRKWIDRGWRTDHSSIRGNWKGKRGGWRGGRGNSVRRSGRLGHEFQNFLEKQNWVLGPPLDNIEVDELSLNEEAPTIKNVRYAASYNWLQSDTPVIAVLGSPPFWAPPVNKDEPLEQDKGDFFRDPNAARLPKHSTEPAIRALLAVKSYVDPGSIDVMACSSVLGNLLRFSSCIPSVFRFDAEIIGDTLFPVRKENSPTELIKGIKGYGHTFPAAYTRWDPGPENSASHQRVITYDFSSLQCLVRFGCDGYVKNPSLAFRPVAGISGTNDPAPDQKLRMEVAGCEIDQASIFEIKTRHISNKINVEEVLPNLWLTQTPGFLEANYDKPGAFMDPHIRHVKSDVDRWEKENASSLRRLHAVLARIREIVSNERSGSVEVSWQGSGPLQVTRAVPDDGALRRALPAELAELWRGKLDD